MPIPTPDIQTIRESLKYNRDDGTLTWRNRPRRHFKDKTAWIRFNKLFAGKAAGCFQNEGYLQVQINGKKLLAHRVVWAMVKGRWPDKVMDHIDGNGLNNRISNLREADLSQNCMNAKRRADAKNVAKGVQRIAKTGNLVVSVGCRGRTVYGGTFSNKRDAIAHAKALRTKLHGAFANHL